MASSESSQSWLPKRQRADSGDSAQSLQYDDYTVGWISALPLEMTAAQAMLDHRHEPLPQKPHDSNCYEFGSINGHNVVIACLPKAQYGNNNAAIVANNMNRTFPYLQHRLLLEASHGGGKNRMLEILAENAARLPHYTHPTVEDRLFHHECAHTSSGLDCDRCDMSQLIIRTVRQHTNPVIHYGRVASGNQVIKDALTRDNISKEIKNICFEMEAASVMDTFPCLAIRGICDYSDSHKNKGWQEYAALVSAAYAKELLMSIPPQVLQPQKRARVQQPKASEPISPEADECLRAMFVTDPSLDREGILDAKGDICEGTCEWILTTDEFQIWDQNPPHLLWISAPPGMGKTFMSIYLSKHLEAISQKESGVATIFFFCDNKDESRNTAVSILRSLMHQLISYEPSLISSIIPQWKQQSQRLFQETSFGTLWKLFDDMIAQSDFETIYCVIDALDECEVSSLSLLLRKFERLSRGHLGSSPKLRLVCLSRRYPENIPEALLLFTKMEFDTMNARKEDISRFISSQVHELAQKKKLSRKMRSNLEDTFQKKSEGTFLWVSFMSQDLQKQRLLDFEASLDMLPAGLDAVYERILQNVEFEKGGIIYDILYWLLVATRPFTISELCEAVNMKPTRLLMCEEVCIELINSCGHLLQTTDKYMRNSVQQTVTFLHQSAKDYLMKFEPRFGSQIPGLAHPQLHEHATIFLLQYLEKIKCYIGIEDKSVDDIANEYPLAYYAVEEWGFHFKELEDITQIMRQGVSFFENDSKVRRMWQQLYNLPEAYNTSKPVPLLHLSVFLALDSLAKWCLRHDGEHDVETKWGDMKHTALVIACERHREYIITLLLDAGANPIADIYLTSALDAALSYCNRRILHLVARAEPCRKFLIEQASEQDGYLICEAALIGNEDACRFLVEDLGWDLNWKSGRVGYSALTCALSSGNFELISCFIKEWHVPIENYSDILKEACSSFGSESDFEKIIRLLFPAVMDLLVRSSQHGINQVDLVGQTVLHYLIESWLIQPTHGTLYYESLEYMTQAAQDLMDLGVDRHIQNSQGLTGLQMLQGHYKEMPGLTGEDYRSCVDRTIILLESYCTVPKH
ncbi:hypothetical protein DER46DRAFT_628411 [Fusarium sp. MPI-SDFR-AT-0072]|nr:hypothetical protein DER46DRAFT_628411 [Fusarium sp. MPI-SDFR-AT-0072]